MGNLKLPFLTWLRVVPRKSLQPHAARVTLYGPLCRISIDEDYQADVGLVRHEIEHQYQNWMTLCLHPLLYQFSQRYRLWSEVQAYSKQYHAYPEERSHLVDLFAGYIHQHYNLTRYSYLEVFSELQKAIEEYR